jgi:hypothetical protein
MGTVTLEQVGGEELALPLRIQEALGELGRLGEGRAARPLGRCRARRARRAARGRGCRDRRAEGQAHAGAHRGPAWARGGRGDARRPSGRGRPAAGAQCRRPLRGAASDVRVLRRPGSAVARGAGADAGWRLHPSLPQDAGAGRPGGGAAGAVDVALGITTEGVKIPLGLWEGSTENASVATALLSDLVERGLDPEQGILFVIDGAKALRKAIRTVFGDAPVRGRSRARTRSNR